VVSLATVSVCKTLALVESAARIALPTTRAPGIVEPAKMLSFWRSVSVSRFTAWLDLSEPPHAAMRQIGTTQRMDFMAATLRRREAFSQYILHHVAKAIDLGQRRVDVRRNPQAVEFGVRDRRHADAMPVEHERREVTQLE